MLASPPPAERRTSFIFSPHTQWFSLLMTSPHASFRKQEPSDMKALTPHHETHNARPLHLPPADTREGVSHLRSRSGPLHPPNAAHAPFPFLEPLSSLPHTALRPPGGQLDGYTDGTPCPLAPGVFGQWGAEVGDRMVGEGEVRVLLPSVFSLQAATGWLCWFAYLFVFGHTRQQAGS